MQTEISLLSQPADKLADALQKSRLAALIDNPTTLKRMSEAAALLLTNEKLRACDEASILGALYKAATLGFRLEPEFGECYLIPRKVNGVQTCVFQIGYKGWKAVALQSGHVTHMGSREVYGEDEFSFEYGTEAYLKHKPASENKGITTHFYAYARLVNGGELIFEVINKQAAEKSRRHSESQYDWNGKTKVFSVAPKDIWLKHYAAMAVRVPIKKLCAMLPLTPAIEAATMADGSITYAQKDGTVTTISPVDVEATAEPVEPETKVDPAIQDKVFEIYDALGSLDTAEAVLRYYADFKTTDMAKIRPCVEMFFSRITQVATTLLELSDFYNLATAWHKDSDLIKILSKRKAEIEAHAKGN